MQIDNKNIIKTSHQMFHLLDEVNMKNTDSPFEFNVNISSKNQNIKTIKQMGGDTNKYEAYE